MILELDRKTFAKIRNPVFTNYGQIYQTIQNYFLTSIQNNGLEVNPEQDKNKTSKILKRLKRKGANFRNGDRSIYINHISGACEACQTGSNSATFFISLKCHRNCFYCFNPNQENYLYYRYYERNAALELKQQYEQGTELKNIALTGGEPLLHKKETLDFFKVARDKYPKAHTRLYTCGDHINQEMLEQLKDAGLQEIRFSIRMHDFEKQHHTIFDRIALARDYIPFVMVEMPVLPDTQELMQQVLLELDRLQIYSINLLEFCYPYNNTEIFREKGYEIKNPPFEVLYNYWYAGGLPIHESEIECLLLLEFALDLNLKIGVHYCSLENKHTGQIYFQNTVFQSPETHYFSKHDYFLKSAKVFGEDIPKVKQALKSNGFTQMNHNPEHDYLEFHIQGIPLLREYSELEIGITYCIFEKRDNENVLRELRVDLTSPKMFNIHDV